MRNRDARYEKCEQCGRTWNTSIHARPYAGVYICPECDRRNRGRQHDGDQDRRDSHRD